jgi:hypothetical protein
VGGRLHAAHTDGQLRNLLDSLAPNWVVTDYDAHMLLVVPFIRMDSINSPYCYINACHSIEAARSDLLAEHAYSELTKLPTARSDSPKAQEGIDKAYDRLLVAMENRRRRHLEDALSDTLSTPSPQGVQTPSAVEVGTVDSRHPLDTLSTP